MRDGTERAGTGTTGSRERCTETARRADFLRREADRVAGREALQPLRAALARRACELDLADFVGRLQRRAAIGGAPAV